jgi:hypothetical protein
MDRELMLDDFRPRLNETFRLEAGASHLDVELTEAEAAGEPRPGLPREQAFSLVFTGPPEPVLPQALYRLEHPEMGRLDIFLVPIGAGPEGVQYEAVFN